MWRLFLLFFPLAVFSSSLPCPSGFDDGGDGSCYSRTTGSDTRNKAYDYCADYGGYMYDVLNAFQNSGVQQRAGNSSRIWLGLTCIGNSTISCAWDYGTPINSSSYTNFFEGGPRVNLGPCVYMDVNTGYWYSGNCSQAILGYGCKYTLNRGVPLCRDYDNQEAFTFRNQCYVPIKSRGFDDAARVCRDRQCGTVASIHSPGENKFISDLGSTYYITSNYMYTGLQSFNQSYPYYWDDGSSTNYTNFGYENPDLGQCVAVALVNDLIQVGQWINTDCGKMLTAVCKRDVVTDCDRTTTVAPTLAPLDCTSPYFYTGSGTIYSPGYPTYTSPNNTCEYLITEGPNQTASLHFQELDLNYYSKITLFSGISDTIPFKIINYNNSYYERYVFSPTNIIRMYYSTPGDSSTWVADYGSFAPNNRNVTTTRPMTTVTVTTRYPYNGNGTNSTTNTGCNSTYLWQGSFQTENYPAPYPQVTKTCSYFVHPQIYYTCIQFETFNIRNGDIVSVWESTSNLIANLSYYNRPDGPYCTYNYNTITVTLTSSQYSTGYCSGFNVKFGPPEYINPTTTQVTTARPTNCGKTYYFNGTVTSTDFPNNYPTVTQNCSYNLISFAPVTCLQFDTFQIRQFDAVALYDGLNSGITIARITMNNQPQGVYCTRYYNSMAVVFETHDYSYGYVKGFQFRFADTPISLMDYATTTPAAYPIAWRTN